MRSGGRSFPVARGKQKPTLVGVGLTAFGIDRPSTDRLVCARAAALFFAKILHPFFFLTQLNPR